VRAIDVFNVALIVLGVAAAVLGVWWVMRDGDEDRDAEDAARAYLDEHGHWPDQTPDQVEQERRRIATVASAPPPLSVPDDEGRV
jgi:hypothetical protein